MDESSFPALGSVGSVTGALPTVGAGAVVETEIDIETAAAAGSLASKLKLKQLRKMFPTVWGECIDEAFISCK